MISPEIPSEAGTRMLFLGEDSLADGFRLIGFETHPSPSLEDTERIFRDLQRERANAFVIVDDDLMEADIPALQQVRAEGGRIVVIAIPPLAGPPRLASKVAERLATMFGNASMGR